MSTKIDNNKIVLNRQLLLRRIALVGLDIILIILSMVLALYVRWDMSFASIEPSFWKNMVAYLPVNVALTLIIFYFMRLYSSLWRFATEEEMKYVVAAVLLSAFQLLVGMHVFPMPDAEGQPAPHSFYLLYGGFLMAFTFLSRFSYRFIRIYLHNRMNRREDKEKIRTMVIGAGSAGFLIIREMRNSKHLNRDVCCVIDDSVEKIGSYLQGVPVVGDSSMIAYYADHYQIQDIIIAIPTLERERRTELLNACQETGCHVLTLPGIYQLVDQEVSVAMLREVQIEDLLGRSPVTMDLEDVEAYIEDKVILVTGGGGSIGSEICRQVACYHPRQLIIFDIYENNAYDIQNDLKHNHPELNLKVLIGSVRNKDRVDSLFETYHPDLVFHAAAHKHVPLMEDSPCEAIKNNVLGTRNVADACDRYEVTKMVLISTDKAVRPTNVMGASKRICELIVQSYSQNSKTEYAAVRFGNVLGSNGSVIPLFRKQIQEGGPVTVTHKDIIRYFMTIPEAVNLVLQCGALANGGELFILDMGKPVKILDLANNMIRLSGLTPGKDIQIEFTGLRPGEKLYEELLINEDNLKKTEKDRIFVAQQVNVDSEALNENLDELIRMAFRESEDIRPVIQRIVPEYVIKKN